MSSRERMDRAMRLGEPDRVPVMCQLAVGHYFLRTPLDPVEIWHDAGAFAEALELLARRYAFDGILVNLPGRDPAWRERIEAVEDGDDGGRRIRWEGGWTTVVPPDDNPRVLDPEGGEGRPSIDDVDPERLRYVEPHGLPGVGDRWAWSPGGAREGAGDPFPEWRWAPLRDVRERAPELSVHGEVFSPFTQLLELVGYSRALMALLDAPGKVEACLEALIPGTVELMRGHARAGADAVLVSSAFAGAGFISPEHYRRFVAPFEARAIDGFREAYPDVPVYTHTCGAIGDRLELMVETGTGGIDTLDPPPLGDVELGEAKARVGDRVFLKGNVDPVGTVLRGTPGACREEALRRIEAAMPGGGYVLSTACSVPPGAPPENIEALAAAAEEAGWYR